MKPVIEICVDRMDSVTNCAKAGIDRIELCAALSEGGLTPSLGFLRQARKQFLGKIMMMIRPRSGDFLYSQEEKNTMLDEVSLARDHGADGVVFGCLQEDGIIDEEFTSAMIEKASSMDITFHRAFDVTPNLFSSLDTLIRLGIPRVLTSGGHADVWQGLDSITALIASASQRITILPGGGLTAARAGEFIQQTGAKEIHLSARSKFASAMKYRRDDIPMGASQILDEYTHNAADLSLLKNLRAL
jgi:copper homeostasis protein